MLDRTSARADRPRYRCKRIRSLADLARTKPRAPSLAARFGAVGVPRHGALDCIDSGHLNVPCNETLELANLASMKQ
jgi:hypothetical protein